jgi:alpha-L-arabinofuranosidase
MVSYAPLLAKKNFTQWTTDMIFFDNITICPTPNYHVQKMFSANQGDRYFDRVISKDKNDTTLAASCVQDSKTGDIILKMVNFGNTPKQMKINLSVFKNIAPDAIQIVLSGNPDAENTFENPQQAVPVETNVNVGKTSTYDAPAMSLTVIRISTKK